MKPSAKIPTGVLCLVLLAAAAYAVACAATRAAPVAETPADTFRFASRPDMADSAARNALGFLHRSDTRAMWLWNETPGVRALLDNTDGARDELFAFVDAPHGQPERAINRIFFAARAYANVDVFSTLRPPIYDPLGAPEHSADAQARLRAFLRQASAHGVAVEYLDGQAIWLASDTNAAVPVQICRDVVAFNLAGDDAAERFSGVHLDIEPHTVGRGPWAGKWWEDRLEHGYNAEWTQRWQHILSACRDSFDAYQAKTGQRLTLAVDVGPDFARYNRPMRRFLDRPAGPVDYVSVLNYYDNRPNRDGQPSFFAGAFDGHAVVGGVDENLVLWRHIPLVFGVETGPTSIAPDRRSFHQEGYRALYEVVDQLQERCLQARCIGVAFHHYGPQAYRALDP